MAGEGPGLVTASALHGMLGREEGRLIKVEQALLGTRIAQVAVEREGLYSDGGPVPTCPQGDLDCEMGWAVQLHSAGVWVL